MSKEEKKHEHSDKKHKHDEKCKCNETCNCGCQDGNECKCDDKKHHHKEKIKELEEKVKNLEEALLRKDADLINYRKRKDDETQRMLKYSNEDIAKDILPIVDNFERAINLDDDNLDDELSKFLEGFKMIYCHLEDLLNKYEIKAIDEAKVPFDPNYHQGVLTEKVEGMDPGMVVEVMQKGYLLKDKVIRSAMVKVSE